MALEKVQKGPRGRAWRKQKPPQRGQAEAGCGPGCGECNRRSLDRSPSESWMLL